MLAKPTEPAMVRPSIFAISEPRDVDSAERNAIAMRMLTMIKPKAIAVDAFGEEIGQRRHGARALHLQPAGVDLGCHADADAEQRRTDEAEAGVAAQHVFGDLDVALGKHAGWPHRTGRRT